MDCRAFRKHHLAYLDDTLSGDLTRAAQQHIMACDGCAAHDTLVRRSLMIARSMPTIAPSEEFQARLRQRLASCREEIAAEARADQYRTDRSSFAVPLLRSPRALVAVATGAFLGTMLWRGVTASSAPELSIQPVIASQPSVVTPASPSPYYSPALIGAMSTGNPVWPAAMIIDEVPTQFGSPDLLLVTDSR
jgi:anti-sigma factor RsiW